MKNEQIHFTTKCMSVWPDAVKPLELPEEMARCNLTLSNIDLLEENSNDQRSNTSASVFR